MVSDHDLITPEQGYTFANSKQRRPCGDRDCMFVFCQLCLLHESDRIDLVRKKILGCLAWGGLDQITEDEAGKVMFRRVRIRCLEIVVALAVEIGEGRGRNIKNISQM